MKIYTEIKKLLGNEQLAPEVREVFDRLLATEEEIQMSQRAAPQNVMAELGDAASPELHERHAKAEQKAHEAAARP